MRPKAKFGIPLAALLIVLVALPVLAASSLEVHIEVPTTLDSTDVDEFTASGPAVDEGLICNAGFVIDLSGEMVNPHGPIRILRLIKQFQCDEGTFDVYLVVRLNIVDGTTTASWKIIGGTGDYAGLFGNGKLVGTPLVNGDSILDIYDGKVR